MWEKISKWYEGEWVPYENTPDSSIHIIGGDVERHWTAEVVRRFVTFYLAHWKWLWGFAVSLSGLYLALQQLQAAMQ